MTTKNEATVTAYGRICNAGGRTIEIQSPHQEWTDYAVEAVNAFDALEAVAEAAREHLASLERARITWTSTEQIREALAALDKVSK